MNSTRWLIITALIVMSGIGVYALTSFADFQLQKQSLENQDYIINTLNDSATRRDQLFQDAKLAILNNMTYAIGQNSHDIREILKKLNITVVVNNVNGSIDGHNITGSISGFSKPIVVG